ncbi:MAG TPA: hypothetical protein VM165_22375 [Planctomycetaceae bacterium]|nr:hypothetical protein [Planctomycetaceae bacterium]
MRAKSANALGLMTVGFLYAGGMFVRAQEAEVPSPFQVVEPAAVVPGNEDALQPSPVIFTERPRNSVTITSSRTHPRTERIDAAGKRRMLSSLLHGEMQLEDGSSGGPIRDVVVGPEGAVEFYVVGDEEQSYLVPYEATRLAKDGKSVQLAMSTEEFELMPSFEGSSPDLSSLEVRWQVLSAYGLGEMNSRIRSPSARRMAAKPTLPRDASTTAAPTAPAATSDRGAINFTGVPVNSNYAGTAPITRSPVPARGGSPASNPSNGTAVQPPAEATGAPVVIPGTLNRLDAAANRAANRAATSQTKAANRLPSTTMFSSPRNTAIFGNATPTNPSQQSGTPGAMPAGNLPPGTVSGGNSTVGGASPSTAGGPRAGTPGGTPPSQLPPGNVAGGGNTVGGASPATSGGSRPGTPGGPAQTPTSPPVNPPAVGNSVPTSNAGTSTTSSPSGTAVPARTP